MLCNSARVLWASVRLVVVLTTGLLLTGAARAGPTEKVGGTTEVPVVFHVAVARTRGGPEQVVTPGRLDQIVERANQILTQAGIRLRRDRIKPMPIGRLLDVRGAWGRNALARVVGPAPPGAVEVFVVRTLGDLKRGWVKLPGVQWYTYRGKGIGRRFVILSRDGGIETLAHELGHYFGLMHHRSRRNLMRPGAARVDSRLTSTQIQHMRRRLEFFLANQVLRGDPVEIDSETTGQAQAEPTAGAAPGSTGAPGAPNAETQDDVKALLPPAVGAPAGRGASAR